MLVYPMVSMVFIQQSHLAMGVVSGSFLLSPNFDPAIVSDVSREKGWEG